ncbi:hypothetical protein E5A73_01505 [Sphingomonas gei]|uniref:Uncharacterized protein n=1 Tax=Sphingomonas gei TaxID=1395960 RepID=A0A4V3QZW6_9SPHN|nr:hypothetical protein [Sphingomonas gei]TGX55832.1 hypothetical protein E5A73_01505 [Sphingomonas gei]
MSNRFRWTTIIRAIELLVQCSTQAQLIVIIEEFGFGDDMDRRRAEDRTSPKLGTMMISAIRREPNRRDSEGELAPESLVRRAAQLLDDPSDLSPWQTFQEIPAAAALRVSLATDGWSVRQKLLVPVTAVPVVEVVSRLRAALIDRGYEDADRRLRQVEAGLDEGHWESANADIRGFLAALFTAIAKARAGVGEITGEEGDARKFLQRSGFFKPDPRDAGKSLEAELVRSLFALLGSEGAHAGVSDRDTATYRYAMAALTADFFLQRA